MRLDHESKNFNLLRNKYVVKVIRSANLLALLQKNWTRPTTSCRKRAASDYTGGTLEICNRARDTGTRFRME